MTFGENYTDAVSFVTNDLNNQSQDITLYYHIQGYNDPYQQPEPDEPQDPIDPPQDPVEPPQEEEPTQKPDDESKGIDKITLLIIILSSIVGATLLVAGFVVGIILKKSKKEKNRLNEILNKIEKDK